MKMKRYYIKSLLEPVTIDYSKGFNAEHLKKFQEASMNKEFMDELTDKQKKKLKKKRKQKEKLRKKARKMYKKGVSLFFYFKKISLKVSLFGFF